MGVRVLPAREGVTGCHVRTHPPELLGHTHLLAHVYVLQHVATSYARVRFIYAREAGYPPVSVRGIWVIEHMQPGWAFGTGTQNRYLNPHIGEVAVHGTRCEAITVTLVRLDVLGTTPRRGAVRAL